jgi:hypothetical protein
MNHDSIAAADVIPRYVAHRLSPDEEQAFEAHLVDCPDCCEQVERELGFRDGLAAAAAERTAALPAAAPSRGESRVRLWPLMAAATVLLAVAAGLAFSLSRTSAALTDALAQNQEHERRADEAAREAQALERRVADLETRLRQPPPASATDRAALLPTTVFALAAVRGGGDEARSVNRFTFDRRQRAAVVVLTVDLPPGAYALTLRDRGGRAIWSGGPFSPSSQDVLAVAVERSLLADGQYTLDVERPGAGQPTRFPFEVRSR